MANFLLLGCAALAGFGPVCSAYADEVRGQDLAPGFLQLVGPDRGSVGSDFERTSGSIEGVSIYIFPDGSRLAVKRTVSQEKRVSVAGLIGQGRSGLPVGLAGASWSAAFLTLGGTQWASYLEIEQWLNAAGHDVHLNLSPDVSAFKFGGSSAATDVAYQVALVCSVVLHPMVSQDVVAKVGRFGSTLNAQINANPGLVFSRTAQRIVSGMGARYSELPTEAEIKATTSKSLDELVQIALAGPVDLAVVGNVDPDEVAGVFSRRCVSDGVSGKSRVRVPLQARFAAGNHAVTYRYGVPGAQTHMTGAFWNTAVYGRGDRHRLALDVLAEVLRVRMSMRLSTRAQRVVPVVVSQQSFDGDDFGYFGVALQTSKASVQFDQMVRKELGSLAKDPALEGQVSAVIASKKSQARKRGQDLDKVSEALAESLSQPDAWRRFGDFADDFQSVSPADVAAAAAWLVQERSVAELHLDSGA